MIDCPISREELGAMLRRTEPRALLQFYAPRNHFFVKDCAIGDVIHMMDRYFRLAEQTPDPDNPSLV